MSKINILSSKVYNRIAAGEVIERPASVVKELVENSIDAGATNVSVEISNGGISYVRVTDNGDGIEKAELKKAILPHATSKISSVKDLENITSLGFRGEALASIASVSKLSIVSKPESQETGASLYAVGGEDEEITDCAAVKGTEITVKNIFFNTPAREKFLKSEKSEENEISTLMARLILGNPDIAFKYSADGKTIFQSYGDGEESAFISVYGTSVIKDCYYVNSEKNGVALKGYIGKPFYSKPNRNYQSVFLNGRYVVNQTVSAAISNAYSSYLMKRQYPFYSLKISVPAETVDVNVHPNKTDVRFSNNQIIYSAVYSVISKVLDGSSEALSIVSDVNKENTDKLNTDYVTHNKTETKRPTDIGQKFGSFVFADSGKKSVAAEDIKDGTKDNAPTVDIFAENKAYIEKLEKEKAANENSVFDFSVKAKQQEIRLDKELKYIGQALNTFLIFDDGQDMYVVDQHAAHERILFDKLNAQLESKNIDTQPLLLPYVFDVDYKEGEFLRENQRLFLSMGISVSDFGGDSFKVTEIPVCISEINLKEFFDDVLSDINELKDVKITELLKEKIAQKACKAAIKSGNKVSEKDIDIIVAAIKENPGLKCPHGRPVVIKITRTEIDKWFKRIV